MKLKLLCQAKPGDPYDVITRRSASAVPLDSPRGPAPRSLPLTVRSGVINLTPRRLMLSPGRMLAALR